MIPSHRLSLAEAEIAVDAALAKATELGVASVVCVSDAAGWPIAVKRPDNGKTISLGMQVALKTNNCKLNPGWVAQLMGYPDNWLDIE